MYCLKCKCVTDTLNQYISFTRNGRRILKGICKICGTIKNRFLASGGSLINKALNVLPLPEMHLKSAVGSENVEMVHLTILVNIHTVVLLLSYLNDYHKVTKESMH